MKSNITNLIVASTLGLTAGAAAQDQGQDQGDRSRSSQRSNQHQGARRGQDRSLEAGSPQRTAPGQDQMQGSRNRGDRQGASRSREAITLGGKVMDLRTRRIGGEQHLFALVRTDQGQRMLFDLGSTDDLRQSGVSFRKQGALRARGRSAQLGQRPVLVVERFQLEDGPTVVVGTLRRGRITGPGQQGLSQSGRGQQGGQGQGSQRGSREIESQRGKQAGNRQDVITSGVALCGRIEDARKYTLAGLPDEHRFMKVRLNGGQTVIVDLGVEPLDDLRLSRGERVWIMGRMGRINGRPVVFASHIADLATVDWSNVQGSTSEASQGRPMHQRRRGSQPGEQDPSGQQRSSSRRSGGQSGGQ